MKASPIQKYALRLLMAAEKIPPPSQTSWNRLQAESADSFLAPFGGSYRAINETELKQSSWWVAPARGPASHRSGSYPPLVAPKAKQTRILDNEL